MTRLQAGLGFSSWQALGFFILATMSRLALEPIQPPTQWVAGVLTLGVKQLGHEVDHSPPCSAAAKHVWSYTSSPPI